MTKGLLRNVILIAFALFTATGTGQAVTWYDIWKDHEPGHTRCRLAFSEEDKKTELSIRYKSWVLGYLTAHGDQNGHELVDEPKFATGLIRQVKKACREAPDEKFASVVRRVIAEDPKLNRVKK